MRRHKAWRIGPLLVMAGLLGTAVADGATAQTSSPMTGPINLSAPPAAAPSTAPPAAPRGATTQTRPAVLAPMVITPPSAQPLPAQRERDAERADQRDSDRLDLERRRRLNDQIDERPTRLGEPTFVQPGATTNYAAPQYPAGGNAASARRGCRQTAPAYDEGGRFLADVCIR